MNSIKAIIPSAGFGTRLLPLSGILPKPLFPILDRTVLDLIVSQIKTLWAPLSGIGINLHHMGNMIKDYAGGGSRYGAEIFYSPEKVILDTGGGLARFADFIGSDECFIVHNCDVIHDLPLNEALQFHLKHCPVLTLLTVDLPGRNRIKINKKMQIESFLSERPAGKGEKLRYGSGIWLYSREIFRYLPRNNTPYPLIPVLKKLMEEKKGSVMAYVPEKEFYWKDIGSVRAYLDCHRDILSGKLNIPDAPPLTDNRWIHPSAVIGNKVRMEGFISAGPGTVIEDKVTLRDTVIWKDSTLKKDSIVSDAVIAGPLTVGG